MKEFFNNLLNKVRERYFAKNEAWGEGFFEQVKKDMDDEKEKNDELKADIKKFFESIEETYTIRNVLLERDELYDHYTNELLSMLKPVFEAASSYLDEDITNMVNWKAVELIDDNAHIIVLGEVIFPIGMKVKNEEDGLVLEVTKENQHHFQRILRIVIPVELAQEGDIEKLKTFFKEHYSLENLPEKPDDAKDFSTEGLTEEQIEKLQMFSQHAKDKIN